MDESLSQSCGVAGPDNGMDMLHLAGCSLSNHLTLIELPCVLTCKQAEAKPRMAEVCQLEERVHAAEGIPKRLLRRVHVSLSSQRSIVDFGD